MRLILENFQSLSTKKLSEMLGDRSFKSYIALMKRVGRLRKYIRTGRVSSLYKTIFRICNIINNDVRKTLLLFLMEQTHLYRKVQFSKTLKQRSVIIWPRTRRFLAAWLNVSFLQRS